ncbi:DUF1178 family protein [Novosphingobium sp.]|uniref:DUF1178 family protein n=1 Tax=Novosphingobium sp. TaxID=1874826 RepID=UPI0033411332
MIVFDLECRAGAHRFEGWFASSHDYADQQARGLLTCPVCDCTDVAKAVMAPNLARKGNQRAEFAPAPAPVAPTAPVPAATPAITSAAASTPAVHQANAPMPPKLPPELPPEAIAALRVIATLQAEALKSSTWVGNRFADKARAMHYGEEDAAPIHGQASPDEARALIDEGVTIAPILFPVAPPGKTN